MYRSGSDFDTLRLKHSEEQMFITIHSNRLIGNDDRLFHILYDSHFGSIQRYSLSLLSMQCLRHFQCAASQYTANMVSWLSLIKWCVYIHIYIKLTFLIQFKRIVIIE